MSMTSSARELLDANERYAASFGKGDLPGPPARKVAILTCMDARIDPARALGLAEGDAHVIRNAGGRASEDALRSLIVSEVLLGTRTVVVMHHTECGMLNLSNDDLRTRLSEDFNADAGDIDFLPIDDIAGSVRDDIATIRESPFIPDDIALIGFVYDVRTGRVTPVE